MGNPGYYLWRIIAAKHFGVVRPLRANEHARSAAGQGRRIQPRMFEGMPARLEEQALLWIHDRRFSRRNLEEGRIERIDVGDVAGKKIAGVEIAGAIVARWAHHVDPVAQHIPETVKIGCPRQAPCHADDGDRSVVRARRDRVLRRNGWQLRVSFAK